MSTVERALKKLRDSRKDQTAPVGPLAQIERQDGSSVVSSEAGSNAATSLRKVEFDLGALKEAGLYAEANKVLADQYRDIKRPLLKKAAETGPERLGRANFIAVTSALANEGKTFTAVNLGLSLTTEKDWNVLLVDADCKNPQLSHLLGAGQEIGLLDLLRDASLGLGDVVIPTNIKGLSFLPLGRQDEHAAELLGSARMDSVSDALCQVKPRQIIILDTAPLLLTTESPIACAHAGQVVVVVKSEQTPQQAVLGGLAKLDSTKAIGLVLNCAGDKGSAYSYGSYSHYTPAGGDNVEAP